MPIEYRTLDYDNLDEMRRYLAIFYEVPAEFDEYYFPRSSDFIEACVAAAREQEDTTNTYAGIALSKGEIVGLHILRRFQEGDRIGVHIAALWVAEAHRRTGIARTLKQQGGAARWRAPSVGPRWRAPFSRSSEMDREPC